MTTARLGLPILAATLIVSAGIVTLWMIGSASGERAKFSSLEIAPAEADAFFAINTDPTSPQWLAVNDSLGAMGVKDPIRRAIDEALAEVNLDWDEDILPVAGDEAFFSVPDFEEVDGSSGFVAGFLIADEDKAQEVFDTLRVRAEEEGEVLAEEEYEGVTIYYTEDIPFAELGEDYYESRPLEPCEDCGWFGYAPCEDGEYTDENGEVWICSEGTTDFAEGLTQTTGSGAVALFDGVLAIGGSTDDVKSVIDVVQGRAPSAEENERLQEFREVQKDDFLMWGYADLATVWDMAEAGVAAEVGLEEDEGFETIDQPEPTMTPAPPQRDNDFAVRSLDSEIIVEATGSLLVTERIVVDFGAVEKHGIFRDISTEQPYNYYDSLEQLEIGQVSVTLDGLPESYEVSRGQPYTEIKIGDPERTITGQHEYEVQYTVIGGINTFEPGPTDFYEVSWNVTGNRWAVPIERASATITVPSGDVIGVNCTVSEHPTELLEVYLSEGCEEGFPALQSVTATTDAPIPPGQALGIRVPVDGPMDAPPPVLVERDTFYYDGAEFPTDEPQEDPIPFEIDTEQLFEQLRGTYDRVGFAVSSTSDGYAVDITVLHAPGFEPKYAAEPTEAFDSHFAESVPDSTMFYLAGYDLYGQNWLPAREYFEDVEFADGKTLDDLLDDFEDETDIDLEDDILSLLTGEYAVAGDVSNWDKTTPDFSILALLDVADEAKAQSTLADVADYLKDQDAYEIDDDGPVQGWNFSGEAMLEDDIGVTVADGKFIAGYPASDVEDAVAGSDQSLASTEDWKKTVGLLPDDTTSIGFISVARILSEVQDMDGAERSLDEATDGEISFDNLGAIRSLGFATTSIDNGFGMHFVVFVEEQ